MDVITIESQAYKDLVSKINTIAEFVLEIKAREEGKENNDSDGWVDSHEVCTFLQISNRTLQRLRASRAVNYSLIRGKTFYRISEIQRLLDENIIRRSDECMEELIKNHTLHVKQIKQIRNNETNE
ncbi:MAG: helix-turn-helix domain-containing protein [Bacteroidales bacterium]|nr:helix-turn-helix domain-containing protein [Bacteroidales bacterium]